MNCLTQLRKRYSSQKDYSVSTVSAFGGKGAGGGPGKKKLTENTIFDKLPNAAA